MARVDTEALRRRHEKLWERATIHPFVAGLGEGTLPRAKFRRYFLQDYVFVRGLARVVAATIARTYDPLRAKPLGDFLGVLMGAEDSLFLGAFKEMGISEKQLTRVRPMPTTRAFVDFMQSVAWMEPYPLSLTPLLVSEGVYHDWAGRLVREGKRPGVAVYQAWIDIHAAKELGDFVGWIRGEMDGYRATGVQARRVQEMFTTALLYEVRFWDMAYYGEEWSRDA